MLAAPGGGTRPTGTGHFHPWWRTEVHGDSQEPHQKNQLIPTMPLMLFKPRLGLLNPAQDMCR